MDRPLPGPGNMMKRTALFCAALCAVALVFAGIVNNPARAADGAGVAQIAKLLLDWRPEPEFGGFYAGNLPGGSFGAHHLNVNIAIAGEGAPTWQLVAAGQTDFA